MDKLIIFLIALSLQIGDQFDILLGFSTPVLYIISIILAFVFSAGKWKSLRIPKIMYWLYAYVIIHVFITYAFIYPNTLTTNYSIYVWDKLIIEEPYYSMVLRYFFYLLSPIILTLYIIDKKKFSYFAKCYIFSLIFSIIISIVFSSVFPDDSRFSGGYKDPNTFGGHSIIALYLCLYLNKKDNLFNYLSVFFVFCVAVSGSRACVLGLIMSIAVLMKYRYFKMNTAKGVVVILAVVVIFISDEYLMERFTQIKYSNDGDLRVYIWHNYLSHLKDYFLFGTGLGHKFDAAIGVPVLRSTHNTYLSYFVQFGIVGFCLMLSTCYYMLKKALLYSKRQVSYFPLYSIILAIFVMFFFSDYDNTREFVLLNSIFLMLYSNTKNRAGNHIRRLPQVREPDLYFGNNKI